jgi:hypothetical protein
VGNVLNLVHHPVLPHKGVEGLQYPKDQIKELRDQLGVDVREYDEGGYTYIYLPGINLPPGCTPQQTDALLCPTTHSGYTSRLFLKVQIQTPKTVNWNSQVFVLGQQWYAFSYNNIVDMPLLSMVMNHLRGMVA